MKWSPIIPILYVREVKHGHRLAWVMYYLESLAETVALYNVLEVHLPRMIEGLKPGIHL